MVEGAVLWRVERRIELKLRIHDSSRGWGWRRGGGGGGGEGGGSGGGGVYEVYDWLLPFIRRELWRGRIFTAEFSPAGHCHGNIFQALPQVLHCSVGVSLERTCVDYSRLQLCLLYTDHSMSVLIQPLNIRPKTTISPLSYL